MSKLGSVIRFTFWSQARTRGFIIGTVFFCLLITIGIHLPLIIQAFNFGGTDKIAVLPSSSPLPAALHAFYAEQEEAEIEIILLDDQGSFEANEALAKEMLFSGEIDGYLVIPGDEQTIAAEAQFKSKDAGSSVQNKLQTALQFLRTSMVAAQFQLSGEELAELNRTFIVESIHIMENDAGKSEQEIAMTIVFVFVMLSMLFGSIFGGGAMVATEVSSEKSSRVMEILITSVKPMVQMFGKVIGVFLIGFVQILIYAAVAIINLMLPYNREAFANFNLDLSALSISMLALLHPLLSDRLLRLCRPVRCRGVDRQPYGGCEPGDQPDHGSLPAYILRGDLLRIECRCAVCGDSILRSFVYAGVDVPEDRAQRSGDLGDRAGCGCQYRLYRRDGLAGSEDLSRRSPHVRQAAGTEGSLESDALLLMR